MDNITQQRIDNYRNQMGAINTEIYYYPGIDLIQCKQNGKMKVGYRGEKAFDLFNKMCRISNAKIYVITE